MTIPGTFVGRPIIDTGGGDDEAIDMGMFPMRQSVMGVSVPHRTNTAGGGNWLALPTADGASDAAMNGYGQNGNSPADGAGAWYEWHFGAINAPNALHLWVIAWQGQNIGKWRVTWNGIQILDWDLYWSGGWQTVGGYMLLTNDPAVASVPRKHTIRFTQLAKNAASGGNYFLLTSMCLYGS